jgi:hypothetical protein
VVAIYIAYVLPTFTRLLSNDFTPGPWNLGRFSKPIGWIAVLWVAFITVLFVLYAGVVVFGAIFLLTIWWLVSVRKWFKGPVSQGDEVTLEKIEAEINQESIYKEPSVAG